MSTERCRSLIGLIAAVLACQAGASAAHEVQSPLQQAVIVEHLGATVPRDLTFTDSSGRPLALGTLLGDGKPLVISLAYFTCPMLCPLGRDGLADALRGAGLRLGTDVRALTVSIDPRDTPARAAEWRRQAAARLGVGAAGLDWHFAVGREPEIRRLADTLGFSYAYDAESGQYSHATAVFLIGGNGTISRYLYGISFDADVFASAVAAARVNTRGRALDRLLLRCFHYVPSLRRHGGLVTWVLRTGGAAVVLCVGSLLFMLSRREPRRRR